MEIFTAEMVVAIGGILATVGAGGKYLLDRIATKQAAMEKRQEEERTRIEAERVRYELRLEQMQLKHERVIADQIVEMRLDQDEQDREIGYLRSVSEAYLRHIAILEALMRAAGIAIPALVLPERPPSEDNEERRTRRRARHAEAC